MTKLGHEVRLIAPQYVRPFVKRQKNDAADAEAIVTAAQRTLTYKSFSPTKKKRLCLLLLQFRRNEAHLRYRDYCRSAAGRSGPPRYPPAPVGRIGRNFCSDGPANGVPDVVRGNVDTLMRLLAALDGAVSR